VERQTLVGRHRIQCCKPKSHRSHRLEGNLVVLVVAYHRKSKAIVLGKRLVPCHPCHRLESQRQRNHHRKGKGLVQQSCNKSHRRRTSGSRRISRACGQLNEHRGRVLVHGGHGSQRVGSHLRFHEPPFWSRGPSEVRKRVTG